MAAFFEPAQRISGLVNGSTSAEILAGQHTGGVVICSVFMSTELFGLPRAPILWPKDLIIGLGDLSQLVNPQSRNDGWSEVHVCSSWSPNVTNLPIRHLGFHVLSHPHEAVVECLTESHR